MINWIARLLNPLFNSVRQREEIEELKRKRRRQDNRIERLTRATMNGDDEWMLALVRKDRACALRIIKECNDDKSS